MEENIMRFPRLKSKGGFVLLSLLLLLLVSYIVAFTSAAVVGSWLNV